VHVYGMDMGWTARRLILHRSVEPALGRTHIGWVFPKDNEDPPSSVELASNASIAVRLNKVDTHRRAA
jgi:hypothetical protein